MATFAVQLADAPRLRALSTGDDLHGAEIIASVQGGRHAIINLPDDLSPDEQQAKLAELEAQGVIGPGHRPEKQLTILGFPVRGLHAMDWTQGDSFPGIGITPETQGLGNYGQGVKVAVLDTVLDVQHPQFARMREEGRIQGDQGTDQEHATHVCATITGTQGIAPGVLLYHQNVLPGGSGSESLIANGYLRAQAWGAQVISASLGGAGASGVISDAVLACRRAGVITVAAAGNGSSAQPVGDPGRSSTWCVMAYDRADPPRYATFTDGRALADRNLPRCCDPGTQIVSALPNGRLGPMSGTSMATPHRAGVIALLLGAS